MHQMGGETFKKCCCWLNFQAGIMQVLYLGKVIGDTSRHCLLESRYV